MKLFDAYSQPGFHTTLSTTFCIDFAAYEQIALSRLRESGCLNNIVVADSRMVTYALEDTQRPPRYAGRRYSLVGAQTDKLFHPKVTLQLGAAGARLIVSSANLTASGIAGNLEVAGEFRMDADDAESVPILQAALGFIEGYIPKSESSAHKQLDWARAHTPWLAKAVPGRSDAQVQFLVSGNEIGIGQRFSELVGNEVVHRLIIVSPYWDEKMSAVQFLQKQLRARETAVVIQPERGLFPNTKGLKLGIFEIDRLIEPRERFAHAKILIAQTKRADHVLFGSPNCTSAALGTATTSGQNVEAALYKRMDAGAAVMALDLDRVFSAGAIPASQVVTYAPAKSIPLGEAAHRQPGRFELHGSLLTWTPTAIFDRPDAVIELLNGNHEVLKAAVSVVGKPMSRLYTVDARQMPSFARVRFSTTVSAPAIVQLQDEILQNLRVPKSKKIQEGLDKLGAGDFEGLFLYEALELIDAEENRISFGKVKARGSDSKPSSQQVPSKKLTYEEFIQARAPSKAPDMQRSNSLATSYVNEVRAALNALIGIGEEQFEELSATDEVDLIPLASSDELANGEDAIENGLDLPSQSIEPSQSDQTGRERERRQNDTEDAIATAVFRFNDRIADAAKSRSLTSRDLLRVRVLLTIVLCAGSAKVLRRPTSDGAHLPILLARGERGWARLCGQILFRLFGATPYDTPLIHQVVFDIQQGQRVPVDILECLATCFWAIGALTLARDERGASTEAVQRAQHRAAQMYGMTTLQTEDLMGEVVLKVMHALSARYSQRLGVSEPELMEFHARMSGTAEKLQAQWLSSRVAQVELVGADTK